MIYNIFSRE